MAIEFYNTRTKERRTVKTNDLIADAHIAAFVNSSDLSPNAREGQDFGWKLAPPVVVEMKRIRQNPEILQRIAFTYQTPLENINDVVILRYISDQAEREEAAKSLDNQDFTPEYEEEIRQLERGEQPTQPTQPEPTDENESPRDAGSDSLLENTRKELVEIAKDLGIEKPNDIKGGKEKIVEAIRTAQALKAQKEE